MAALGVPTARALAAVTTGQEVVRETLMPGAVFTRVAASHMRVGTFQYFRHAGRYGGVRIPGRLCDCPAITPRRPRTRDRPYRALLEAVIARQAALIAQWMLLGFIHGVMNTDNMSISGETIDYGPCAFMEAYDPRMVYSSIDHQGRYCCQQSASRRVLEPDATCRGIAASSGAGGVEPGGRAGCGVRGARRLWSAVRGRPPSRVCAANLGALYGARGR